MPLSVLSTLAGAALVAATLWDVLHTLFHPSGQGRVSHTVMAGVWRLTGRLGRRARRLSGPLAMAAAIGTWGVLVVTGGALVYWPHLPGGFSYSPGLVVGERTELLDAFYLSLVTMATLGFGDIVPTVPWLLLATPLQALIGFALLTAAVSWILQISPALTRRRTLSVRLEMLHRSGGADALDAVDAATAARLLEHLAAGVAQVRTDLTQYAETYYFRDSAPETALARTLNHAGALARAGLRSERDSHRLAATILTHSLDDLADVLDDQFLHIGAGTAGVLAAYAAAHEV